MTDLHPHYRIGVDLGGTKISAVVMEPQGNIIKHTRIPSPQKNYTETIAAVTGLVLSLEQDLNTEAVVGIGMPGSLSPHTGLVQNANSTWLNGRPFNTDLQNSLDRRIRFANDADCFALSEARDGAGKDCSVVFGVIIGTGCGGGLVIAGKILNGPRGTAGEWGHTPLPWPSNAELNVAKCWCGLSGCMETWVSGPGFSADHFRNAGEDLDAEVIVDRAANGDSKALSSLERLTGRLARGLAACVNIIDPDIIILGGGLSKISSLYDRLPGEMAPYLFCDHKTIRIEQAAHGDDSGVRGAARLWDDDWFSQAT